MGNAVTKAIADGRSDGVVIVEGRGARVSADDARRELARLAEGVPSLRLLAVKSVGLEMLPAEALDGWAATLARLQLSEDQLLALSNVCWARMTQLINVSAEGNRLTEFPAELGSAPALQELSLANNFISSCATLPAGTMFVDSNAAAAAASVTDFDAASVLATAAASAALEDSAPAASPLSPRGAASRGLREFQNVFRQLRERVAPDSAAGSGGTAESMASPPLSPASAASPESGRSRSRTMKQRSSADVSSSPRDEIDRKDRKDAKKTSRHASKDGAAATETSSVPQSSVSVRVTPLKLGALKGADSVDSKKPSSSRVPHPEIVTRSRSRSFDNLDALDEIHLANFEVASPLPVVALTTTTTTTTTTKGDGSERKSSRSSRRAKKIGTVHGKRSLPADEEAAIQQFLGSLSSAGLRRTQELVTEMLASRRSTPTSNSRGAAAVAPVGATSLDSHAPFSTLRVLDLSGNNLKELPGILTAGTLVLLESLFLARNRFREVPADLSSFPALKSLDLSDNSLHMLKSDLFELTSLQHLTLSGNKITVLPALCARNSSLRSFYLARNELCVLPGSIANLEMLSNLDLGNNRLNALPPEIGLCKGLWHLRVPNNALAVLPPEIGSLESLRSLDVSSNSLDALPSVIGELKSLSHLFASDNQIKGLPISMRGLAALDQLRLARNVFTELPPVVLLLKLHELDFDENPFDSDTKKFISKRGALAFTELLRSLMRQFIAQTPPKKQPPVFQWQVLFQLWVDQLGLPEQNRSAVENKPASQRYHILITTAGPALSDLLASSPVGGADFKAGSGAVGADMPDRPSYYLTRENLTLSDVRGLRVHLGSQPVGWVETFVAGGGAGRLIADLFERRPEVTPEFLEQVVSCLLTLVRANEISNIQAVRRVALDVRGVSGVAQCLAIPHLHLLRHCVDFLCYAFLALKDTGNFEAAMEAARERTGSRLVLGQLLPGLLMKPINDNEQVAIVPLRHGLLTLLNWQLEACASVPERFKTRQQLLQDGLSQALGEIDSVEAQVPEKLLEQIDLFREYETSDFDEMMRTADVRSLFAEISGSLSSSAPSARMKVLRVVVVPQQSFLCLPIDDSATVETIERTVLAKMPRISKIRAYCCLHVADGQNAAFEPLRSEALVSACGVDSIFYYRMRDVTLDLRYMGALSSIRRLEVSIDPAQSCLAVIRRAVQILGADSGLGSVDTNAVLGLFRPPPSLDMSSSIALDALAGRVDLASKAALAASATSSLSGTAVPTGTHRFIKAPQMSIASTTYGWLDNTSALTTYGLHERPETVYLCFRPILLPILFQDSSNERTVEILPYETVRDNVSHIGRKIGLPSAHLPAYGLRVRTSVVHAPGIPRLESARSFAALTASSGTPAHLSNPSDALNAVGNSSRRLLNQMLSRESSSRPSHLGTRWLDDGGDLLMYAKGSSEQLMFELRLSTVFVVGIDSAGEIAVDPTLRFANFERQLVSSVTVGNANKFSVRVMHRKYYLADASNGSGRKIRSRDKRAPESDPKKEEAMEEPSSDKYVDVEPNALLLSLGDLSQFAFVVSTLRRSDSRRRAAAMTIGGVLEWGQEAGRRVIVEANMHGLVDHLMQNALATTHDPNYAEANYMQRMLFATYRSFTTAQELFDALMSRYYQRRSDLDAKKRLFEVISKWMDVDYQSVHPDVKQRYRDFLVVACGDSLITREKMDTKLSLYLSLQLGRITADARFQNLPARPTSLLTLMEASPTEIAQQLCLLSFVKFSAICEYEFFASSAWSRQGFDDSAPNLTLFAEHFNTLVEGLACAIVSERQLAHRRALVQKLIEVGVLCRQLHNYHGMAAISAALGQSAVGRLKYTFEKLPASSKRQRDELLELINNNYRNYRAELRDAVPPCIPMLLVTTSDLLHVLDGNPTHTDIGLINVGRCCMQFNLIENLLSYSRTPFRFNPIPGLLYALAELPVLDARSLYDMSLEIEPRE